MESKEKQLRIFTIGHSNRTLEDFLSLLKEFGIETLADIRRFPGSRKFPYFNREALQESVEANEIHYIWLENLGGRRHSKKNVESPNMGLRSLAFRNYADYMAADEFHNAIAELLKIARQSTTAIMCAEALYWRCHRKLVSDFLTANEIEVKHILTSGKLVEHKTTEGAVVTESKNVYYPGSKPAGTLFEI